ncbi:hypothetical protein ABB02_00269 [Clostridiaceae bacterium JG1575]|nr:hypothetical protein ABB02_00269 [Clostridiaceae bacterium JG1575]
MKADNGLNMQLHQVVEEVLSKEGERALGDAASALSKRYRTPTIAWADLAVASQMEALGYLAWRLPATALVLQAILRRIPQQALPEPLRVLDLGAGPASSVPALLHTFPMDLEVHLLEEQPAMKMAGEKLLRALPLREGVRIHWQETSFAQGPWSKADLVLASYMVNELKDQEQEVLLQRVLAQEPAFFLLVVPGTPHHTQGLMRMRTQALAQGYHVLAPCTFNGPCPMEESESWCHFSLRIQRSARLRRLKGATLAYEDEKFQYMLFSKAAPEGARGRRILRHPLVRKGARELLLCDETGIHPLCVRKKEGERYQRAKDGGWGDVWWDEEA